MKFLLTFVTTIALASAAAVDNKYDMHYSQHQSSVDNARINMQERLSKLESQQRQYSSGGTENYGSGCASCVGGGSTYSSRLSSSLAQNSRSSSSSGGGVAPDYVGVGVVGHAADVRSTSSRFASTAAYEQDDLQQRVLPADLNAIHASAYRTADTEHDEDEDVQRTVGVGFRDGVVNNDRYTYAQRRHQQQQQEQSESESRTSGSRLVPVYYVPGGSSSVSSSSSQRHAAGSESERHELRGGNVPVGNYVSMAVRPGTATVLQVPVRVNYIPGSSDQYGATASSRSEHAAEASESTQSRVQSGSNLRVYPASTTNVRYYPASRSHTYSAADRSRSESESSRVGVTQQPERYTGSDLTSYNSYNSLDAASQSRFNQEQEQEQVQERVSPTIDNASSSRYGSTSVRGGGNSGVRVVPAFPVHTIESASSQRTAEEREQRRYTAARPSYVRPTETDDDRYAGRTSYSRTSGSGSDYSTSRSALQSQSQQQGSSSQHQSGAGVMRTSYGGYPRPAYTSSNQAAAATGANSASHLSSRFGSGVMSTGSDDLHQYMSESERLARIQQMQIAGSSRSSSALSSADEANRRTVNTAQHLDAAAANFVGSANAANRHSDLDTVETFPGSGFQRVKSWSKQSKWASGSEYDQDGKIKSHSMLSTAESEKHNLNGEETGYKAATTTLENDGKVSTYSIHTP